MPSAMPCVTSALVDEPRRPQAGRQTLPDTLAAAMQAGPPATRIICARLPAKNAEGGGWPGRSGVATSRRRGREMIVFHTDGVRDAFVAASFFCHDL